MALKFNSRDVKKKLERLVKIAPDTVGKALYEEALKVEKVSRSRTPVDTGALRASHHTNKPEYSFGGEEISVRIEVGGPAAKYAVHVHYRDELKHKVGQSRFLESAVNEAAPGMKTRIARAVVEAMRRA